MKALKKYYTFWFGFGILISLFSLALATASTPIIYFLCWNAIVLIPFLNALLLKYLYYKFKVVFIVYSVVLLLFCGILIFIFAHDSLGFLFFLLFIVVLNLWFFLEICQKR